MQKSIFTASTLNPSLSDEWSGLSIVTARNQVIWHSRLLKRRATFSFRYVGSVALEVLRATHLIGERCRLATTLHLLPPKETRNDEENFESLHQTS